MRLNIFIPSKGRAGSAYSVKTFPSATIVVHSKSEQKAYRECYHEANIIVSGVKADAYGLTRQREWICNNLVSKNEWIVFADDNIRVVLALPEPHYLQSFIPIEPKKEICSHWRPLYRTLCAEERFLDEIVPDIVSHCKVVGAHLAGFPSTDNILFRKQKFRDVAYVSGKMMIWHNTGEIPFDHSITMEDFYHTAENLRLYGRSVVNNFVWPRAYHYESGGMGRYEERISLRKADVKILMGRYPGLFRVKDREGFEPGTDLQLNVLRDDIDQWRRFMSQKRLV